MKKPTLRSLGIQFGLWIVTGSVAVALIFLYKDDRFSAIIAGVVFAGAFLFTKYALRFDVLSAPLLYLGMLGLFHLGLVVPWALGLYDPWQMPLFYYAHLTPALGLVTLAVLCYQFGVMLGARRQSLMPARKASLLPDRNLFRCSIGLLILGVVMYAVGHYLVFRWRLDITYLDSFALVQQADSRWLGLAGVVTPVAAYAALAGASRTQTMVLLGLVAAWVTWLLYLGSRGHGLILAAVVVYLLAKKGLRPSRGLQLVLIGLVLFSIPAVKAIRNELGSHRLQALSGANLNPLDGIAEMGGSVNAVVQTHRLVDSSQYRHGLTYVHALSSIIPQVPWRYKPGERLATLERRSQLSPALWLVWETNPGTAKRYGGLGFSSVAEAYMNFGFVGVCLIFLGFGYLLAFLDALSARGPYLMAAQAIVLGPLLWTVRNDFTVFVRSAGWGLAYILVVWLVFVRSRRGARVVAGSRTSSRGPGLGPARSALPGQATCGRSGSSTVPAQSD